MSRFITRVELYGTPSRQDYDNLHAAMEVRGFARTIRGDNGTVYKLPTATYYGEGLLTPEQVRQQAANAAFSVWNSCAVFTCEAMDSSWSGLELA
ncbi:hypothetical protein CJU94_19555 [Paraburkholderia aromaticivorans]|uniref:DUF2622 domain-containing protein n=1 Tax=Paraburkholderia aromaticivorans TaxID=2026199 RepID=A0A248VP47_9BURK|nr:hypothetical protein CJU94_19555 [Paraburkholderia aromaticivorans]